MIANSAKSSGASSYAGTHCPTSTLYALPIHAAGPQLPKRHNLPDIYVSSYTPTFSALIQAREGIRKGYARSATPSLLVVAPPNSTIPMGEKEVQIIRDTPNIPLNCIFDERTAAVVILSNLCLDFPDRIVSALELES